MSPTSLSKAGEGQVVLAWRDQAAEARGRLRKAISPAAQAGVGAAAAWFVAHNLLGHPEPFFAPIAAAIAISTNNVRRARRAAQMVGGVALGIIIGEGIWALMGTNTLAVGVAVLVAMAAARVVGAGFLGEGALFANQSAGSAILVVALHKHGTGGERLLDALAGGAAAAVIGVGLFPAEPLALIHEAERDTLRALGGALARVSELLGQGSRPDFDWILEASRDVNSRVARLAQARLTAQQSVRIAPRRWSLREAVQQEEARIRHVDLLANTTLSLLRSTGALPPANGEPTRRTLHNSIETLASSLSQLAVTPQPWSEHQVARVAERVRTAVEAVESHSAHRPEILAALIRATGQELLQVMPTGP